MRQSRRFPAPWSAELQPNYYVVRDADGQQLAYIYYSNDPDRRSAAKLLVFDLDHSAFAQTERRLLLKDGDETLEKKMIQRTVHYSAIAMIIPAYLFSVAMLISAGDVAQAKRRTAAACGKELQSQCIGMPSLANNMLACLAKARVSPRCHAVAQNVVRSCE